MPLVPTECLDQGTNMLMELLQLPGFGRNAYRVLHPLQCERKIVMELFPFSP